MQERATNKSLKRTLALDVVGAIDDNKYLANLTPALKIMEVIMNDIKIADLDIQMLSSPSYKVGNAIVQADFSDEHAYCILERIQEVSFKTTDDVEVVELGYVLSIMGLLMGSLVEVLNQINRQLDESEDRRLHLGDALAGLAAQLSVMGSFSKKLDHVVECVNTSGDTLTLEKAAKVFGISQDTLSQWVQDGRLGCAKIGGKNSYFLKSEIEKTIAENYRRNPRKPTQKERVEQVLYGKNH